MTIATGVAKKLVFKRQSGLGVVASAGDVTAKYLRRVTSTVDLAKQTYKSAEILPSMQRRDFRHGVRSVAGTIHGELSIGTYQAFLESILRQAAQIGGVTPANITITSAVTAGTAGTFTRVGGSFVTDGFKVGDVMQWAGWTAPAANNNAHNFLITAVSTLVLTVLAVDSTPVIAKAAGDSVNAFIVGKKIWIPGSGQTRDYYTFEHAFTDIVQSEVFTDCVISTANLNLPATGMAIADFGVMGLNVQTGTAAFFTAAAAASTGGILAAVNGVLLVGGLVVGLVTGLSIATTGNYSAPGGVVGKNVDPDIFPGSVDVTGQATVYFQDNVLRDAFLNETEVAISVVLAATSLPNSACVAINMSRVKFGGATKDDGEKGLILTMPYTALENISGSLVDLPTTISIQDSAFV